MSSGPSTRLQLASSLASARRGQLIIVSRKGKVMSERALVLRTWLLPAVCTVGIALTSGPVVGGLYAAFVGGIRFQARHYRRALAAFADHRHEEALAHLARARRAPLRPAGWYLDALEGRILWRLGRLPEALRCFEAITGKRRRWMAWWLVVVSHVALLLAMGELERARALRPLLDGAPSSEVMQAQLDALELLFAFTAGDDAAIPSDEALHERVSRYLVWEAAGSLNQLLLAWAFQRRGDLEVAGLCLHRAEETSADSSLERVHPALDGWRRAHRDALLAAMPALDE